MKERRLSLAILAIIISCLAFGLFEPTFPHPITPDSSRNHGPIKAVGVGIYSDPACTQVLDFIDWGMLEPGASQNLTCYVRNEGRRGLSLSLYENNWNPSYASQFVALRWDYRGELLSPGKVIHITLVLSLSANVPSSLAFTFDSIIASQG